MNAATAVGPRRERFSLSSPLAIGTVLVAGVAVGLIAEHAGEGWLQPAYIPILDVATGWLLICCGVAASVARPRQPAGARLVLAGFLWFIGTFGAAEPILPRALGFSFGGYYDLVLLWLALSYPNARPPRGIPTAVLNAALVLFVTQSIVRLVATLPPAIGAAGVPEETWLPIVAIVDAIRASAVVAGGAVVLIQLARATREDRRHLSLVKAAGGASALAAGFSARYALTVLGVVPDIPEDVGVPLTWAFNVTRILVPLAILAGVLRQHATRSAIAGAVAEVGDGASTATLRSALAAALGDPALRVFAWDQAAGSYRERDGQVVDAAEIADLERDARLAVVRVDSLGDPLAILVVARSVAEDPAVLDAGVALTRLVVRNRAQADRIADQLAEVRASRTRIVEAADTERRRIERDLHDGLQQRMVALALELRAAERSEDRDAALRRGSSEVLGILEDVRELARGIHPAVLTEAGLAAAVRGAADRSPIPAELELHLAGRGSAAAQAVAYFVVSEGLANVAKHAREATCVWLTVDDSDDRLVVSVEDDGPGGADPRGRGLAGLADRVAAFDGRFAVLPREGGGTKIIAQLPIE